MNIVMPMSIVSESERDTLARYERTILDLRDVEERYLDLLTAFPWPVLVHSEWSVVVANPAAVDMVGAHGAEQLIGRPVCEVIALQPEQLHAPPPGSVPVYSASVLTRADGSRVQVSVATIPCRYRGRSGAQIVIRPTAEVHQLPSMHRRHDSLTGLPNRSDFRDRLVAAMARGGREERIVGVMMLDLDRIADINARFGFAAGDSLLQQVARRLEAITRRGDTLARIGGDEFGVILEGVQQREQLPLIGNRFLNEFQVPFTLHDTLVPVRASIGISDYPAAGRDIDALLRTAEVAMYTAKGEGRNTFCVYTPQLDEKLQHTHRVRAALATRFETLTAREQEVADEMVAGKSSKVIAQVLGCSYRTIEAHRANIMRKMSVDSLPDLVRVMVSLGKCQ